MDLFGFQLDGVALANTMMLLKLQHFQALRAVHLVCFFFGGHLCPVEGTKPLFDFLVGAQVKQGELLAAGAAGADEIFFAEKLLHKKISFVKISLKWLVGTGFHSFSFGGPLPIAYVRIEIILSFVLLICYMRASSGISRILAHFRSSFRRIFRFLLFVLSIHLCFFVLSLCYMHSSQKISGFF